MTKIEKIVIGIIIISLVFFVVTCRSLVSAVDDKGLKNIVNEVWQGKGQ